jgi:putative transposase
MKLMKTYKFKLKPTKRQKETFESWKNTCRFLFNLALNERIMVYEMRKKSVSKFDQYNELPTLKKENPWLSEVYSETLQEVLDRLDKTYQNFFRGAGFPKYAKKGEYNSFTFKRHFKVGEKTIKLPKIGEVEYFNSRPIEGAPKTATIKKEGNAWFICITAEYETPFETIEVDNQNPIGIDCGATRYLALSNNTFIDSPSFYSPFERQLKLLQRKLSRQKKGSKEREKTKQKIRKIYSKIQNQRLDFTHKVSTQLSNEYSAVYMENLSLQKMQQNGFSNVNKEMADKSFGTLKLFLSYKLKERGKHLGLINPAYTSQTCNSCGTVDKKSRISQAEFVCTNCGTVENADINASIVILREGISQSTKRKALV